MALPQWLRWLVILSAAAVACGGEDSTPVSPPATTPPPTVAPEPRLAPVVMPQPHFLPLTQGLAQEATPPFGTTFGSTRKDDLYQPYLPPPDTSKIRLTWQGNGFTRVEGEAGAIPGSHPIYVVSPNTGYAAATYSDSNGRFSTIIAAPPGSWVIVKYDPTDGSLMPDVWSSLLDQSFRGTEGYPHILENPRPARVNAAPGATVMVPFEPPLGQGVPFVIGGATLPEHLDFQLSGHMELAQAQPGGTVLLSGTLTVYAHRRSAAAVEGKILTLPVQLSRLFNQEGMPRTPENQFFSTILTPTGMPVEQRGGRTLANGMLESQALVRAAESNVLEAPFTASITLPKKLSEGIYNLWVEPFAEPLGSSLEGPRPEVNPLMANRALPLPPFTIGKPAQPHLIWTLLTDVLSADGSRGTIAREDRRIFQLSSRIATQSRHFIVPRVSRETGEPIAYRLEPYLPMIAHGDRYIPNVPNITFKFPSGQITVRITRPDGNVDNLGPAPFIGAGSRTPMTGEGFLLDDGGGHLADVLQLTTGERAFSYAFPAYGEYTIQMTGWVEDIYGNSYEGGGTYTVFVAEPLDIEPATLPMTPFQVGDALNPGVTVLPGVPAEVEVRVTLLEESDPARQVTYLVKGRANRFGTFTPSTETPPVEMTGPGEFVVETTARYTDESGVLWMGAIRWGMVVETPGSPLIAHGRRGRDDTPLAEVRPWFLSDRGDETHVWLPYHSGDVLWQRDLDAARIGITVQDREGLVSAAMDAWAQQWGNGDLGELAAIGELPLTFATRYGYSAAQEPQEIMAYGYWYAGIERASERVREMVSDDGAATGYWRFEERYAMQPGMGLAGDLPNDFKFQFGGGVFRDTTRDINRYAIYGSLWVQLPDSDPAGSRVFPPFRGAAGGPDGGPIMRLGDREIDLFLIPLAVRPGTVLEAGDTFSFSGQVGPPLDSQVEVTVTGPGGFRRTITGQANKVGYFYDPAQDFAVRDPGVYHVSVSVTHTGETSAGPVEPPYPTGSILSAAENGFDVYVVEQDSPALTTKHPWRSVVNGRGAVPLSLELPADATAGTLHYTIGMPGFLLETGAVDVSGPAATVVYDPIRLAETFPNIDVFGRVRETSLSDTVWVGVLLETVDAQGATVFHARHMTLQGPDLLAPPQGGTIGTAPPPIGRPASAAACTPREITLYGEGFESGAIGWTLNPASAWEVVGLKNGGHALRGRGRVRAYPPDNLPWEEAIWRLQVRWETGQVYLNVQVPGANRYVIKLDTAYSQLQKYLPPLPGEQIDTTFIPHPANQWHIIEVGLRDGAVMVWVDGTLETVFTDSDPLTLGSFWVEVVDGVAYFDDLVVCQAP